MTAKVILNVPTDLDQIVRTLAEKDERSVTNMYVRVIRAGVLFDGSVERAERALSQPQTTIPAQQAFNPIKDSPRKRWPFRLIPEGQPTKVIMDSVMVVDHATKEHLSFDHVAVSFSERKIDGILSIVPSVESGFIDYRTGEPVPHININTPDGPEQITRMVLKLVNSGDLVRRWLDGLYFAVDSVDNWEQHVLRIVGVKDGRPYVEMAPIVPGRFVPSEEQYEEYRKDREWSEEQIEKFIELRSQVVPGGPDWLTTLNGLYAQVDRMEVK